MSNDEVSAMEGFYRSRIPADSHMPPAVTAESAPLLSRDRIVAAPGFNRWLVPPAALAIHLSIGMAYGLSVFWLPLSRAIGISRPAPDDWKISTVTWTFTLAIVFLGSSAA